MSLSITNQRLCLEHVSSLLELNPRYLGELPPPLARMILPTVQGWHGRILKRSRYASASIAFQCPTNMPP
jgi:hypothetical protein